ncbi:cyanobactin biosynthesis PatC/TenC/TruC family protein [Roseofilum casamattae]|uniref:Cyanobactin biosynthesis PatC/TenC/TruC family protein n=1 Tax=Roseofilum casamattae BLCC-M143 TaxID=3022442 RepID=A0ABT7C2D7_9CYAN|nr:cyanobactin biosynthesis PatC/TenC/TruC family protein [Roseofilum casamattae]MDJ1185609.1 cyanobactin biosynthesis PatC/TenC/TruC family protein [Roseofilum casamattae BLCC-M143]
MAEAKGNRKKANAKAAKTTEQETASKTSSNEPEQSYILATGLEDYGRWKTMFKDHQRDKDEKPFRRGRIWC